MPANLPPEYFAAEKRYKEATTPHGRIAALEDLIATVPKHKGTDKLRADLRKRLSQLREEAIRKKKSGKSDLYTIERQGAAQAALVGFPNSGKSSLLAALTNAHPVIADYPVSTVMPLSGMMPFEDIQFQLVDLPPIGNESTDGWVSGILKNADLLILVIDLSEDPGVQVELLTSQMRAWRIALARKDERAAADEGNRAKPCIIATNKIDLPEAGENLSHVTGRYAPFYAVIGTSAKNRQGIDDLRRAVFETARVVRVYSKEPGREPDRGTPFTLPEGASVLDLAALIHKDFVASLSHACIWGSARFDGQRVQRDYVLKDRDIVEFHLK
jgi:ribosome-interacting GTPase 1